MSAIDIFGLTLLHFLWQGALIAAAFFTVRACVVNGGSANARYLVGCVTLAAMLIVPIVTFVVLGSRDVSETEALVIATLL